MRRLLNRRTLPAATPFDVPCDTGYLGVQHSHGTLLTALALQVSAPGPQPLGEPWRPGGYPGPLRIPGLRWDTLAAWSAHPEAVATELSVLTRGQCTGDDGPAARAYRTLLGPLSVAGERRVHLVIRFASLAHPELVARYGSGRSAALRAALAATRKVTALLRGDGLTVTGLTAAELTDLADELSPDQATAGHYIVAPDDPAQLPESLESAWHYGASAGPTLIWATSPEGPVIRAMADVGGSLNGQLCGDLPAGWRRWRAAGRTGGAAITEPTLPSGSARSALAGAVIPVAGAGIVLGADSTGRPVTMRLAGPDVPVADVAGDVAIAQRLVVRLAALGRSCAVFTHRPEPWEDLMDRVGDRRLVHPAAAGAADVLIDDRPDGHLGPLSGHTVIRVREDTRSVPGIPSLYQDPDDPANATIGGTGTPLQVRLVSTSAENALLSPEALGASH